MGLGAVLAFRLASPCPCDLLMHDAATTVNLVGAANFTVASASGGVLASFAGPFTSMAQADIHPFVPQAHVVSPWYGWLIPQ